MLQKQSVPLNFNGGLDTKSDPWQVQIGKFLELENSIFNVNGRLQKRDGFEIIGTTNDPTVNQITTYNDDVIAVGNSIYAFNQANGTFTNKGSFYPANVSTLSAVSNSSFISFSDTAKSPNGLICTGFVQSSTSGILSRYTIQSSTTGQVIVNPTNINPNGGTVTGASKVYYFNNRFVLIFSSTDGVSNFLKFITIDISTLSVTSAVTIANDYDPSAHTLSGGKMPWDATVADSKMFVGYNVASSGGFNVGVITSAFAVISPIQVNTVQADVVGSCNNGTTAYFAHYQNSTGDGQIVGVDESAGTISVASGFPKQWILTTFTGDTTASNSTITAISSTANIFPDVQIAGTSVSIPYSFSGPFLNLKVDSILTANTLSLSATPTTSNTGVVFTLNKVLNISMEVVGSTITILSEIKNVYPYVNSPTPEAPTNLVYKRTCSTSGVVGPAPSAPTVRGIGLWSKAFKLNNQIYFVSAYSKGNLSTLYPLPTTQPCYFVMDENGNEIAKLSYQNGAGYQTVSVVGVSIDSFVGTTTNGSAVVTGIASTSYLKVGQRVISSSTPATDTYIKSIDSSTQITLTRNATASGSTVFTSNEIYFAYLQNNRLEASATGVGIAGSPVVGLFSNLSARACKLELLYQSTNFAELSGGVNLSGGFLWGYDGVVATENNFFVYPDTVAILPNTTSGNMEVDTYTYLATYEWTDNQGNINRSSTSLPVEYQVKAASNFSGNTTINSNVITNISSTSVLQAGQRFSGGSFGAGVYITSVDSSSQITVSQLAGATATGVAFTMSNAQRVQSVTVCVPTLRLSYKTNVIIVLYRYSANQQTFYQLNSVLNPLENNPLVDFVTYSDSAASTAIVGNNILYSNGDAQIQNIGPSSCKSLTIFDGRLWFIDSENPNNIWYSKQAIQTTPVEMSPLFSLYISPTQSSQGSTGPVRCLFPMDDKLIIFKDNAIYYINGTGPDNSGANSQYSEPILITSTVGCSNQKSIVFMQNGLMFQSNKGIWVLGRDLSSNYIGVDVERTTDDFLVTSAQLIPGTTEVRIALNDGTSLMYDYFYKQWSQFTGMSNISSIITNKLQTYLNNNGEIRRQTRGKYLDGTSPILMKFRTAWFSLAGLQGFQRAYFLFLLGKYMSPHRINLSIAYDFNTATTQTVTITPVNFAPGLSDSSDVEKWRIMLTNQKCESLQMIFQEVQDSLTAGEGLELSELSAVVGLKKGYRTQNQFTTIG